MKERALCKIAVLLSAKFKHIHADKYVLFLFSHSQLFNIFLWIVNLYYLMYCLTFNMPYLLIANKNCTCIRIELPL